MTTYYISSEATNGYVVGNDANDGLSRGAAWLTLDNVTNNLTSGTHTIYLNGAEVDCTAEFIIQAELTMLGEFDKTQINLRAVTSGSSGMRSVDLKHLTASNLAFTSSNVTTLGLIHLSPRVSKTNWTFTDCSFVADGRWISYDAYTLHGLEINNCTLTATNQTDYCGYVGHLGATSVIAVNGLEVNVDIVGASNWALFYFKASYADVSVSFNNVTGTITTSFADGGFIYGLHISDADTALIENCNLTLNGMNDGDNSGCLYKITSASQTIVSAAIRNNRGTCNTLHGIMILAGLDGTANLADNVQVYGNRVEGHPDHTTLHGIESGGQSSSRVYNNYVKYANIAYISKNSDDDVFAYNVAEYCAGQAYRMKGAENCWFVGNLHIVSGSWNGKTIYITSNDASPHTTGSICAGNAVLAKSGATAQVEIVNIEPSQEAKFSGNVYYPVDGFSGSQFNDQGTTRTLAEWNGESHVYGDLSFAFSLYSGNRIPKIAIKIGV